MGGGGMHGGGWRGNGWRGGVYVGVGPGWGWGPYWGGWGYPYPYYGYPSYYGAPYGYPYGYPYGAGAFSGDDPVEVDPPVEEAPPLGDGATASSSDPAWYYCPSAHGYYPDVPECPEAWVKVPPRASSTYRSEDVR